MKGHIMPFEDGCKISHVRNVLCGGTLKPADRLCFGIVPPGPAESRGLLKILVEPSTASFKI
jgi:hypothetical protein